MMPPEADAVTIKPLLRANENDATVSGDYTSVLDAIGDIVIIEDIGAVTGTIAGKLWTASAADGTDAAVVTFNDGTSSFSSRTGSNYLTKKVMDSRRSLGYIGYVGTVTTGPIHMAVTAVYRPKYTS